MKPPTCYVSLVSCAITGRTLFWRRDRDADLSATIFDWGKPVGSCFGTHFELWATNEAFSVRMFPFPDVELLSRVQAAAAEGGAL